MLPAVMWRTSRATLSLPPACRVGRSPVLLVLQPLVAKGVGWTPHFPPLAMAAVAAAAARRTRMAVPLPPLLPTSLKRTSTPPSRPTAPSASSTYRVTSPISSYRTPWPITSICPPPVERAATVVSWLSIPPPLAAILMAIVLVPRVLVPMKTGSAAVAVEVEMLVTFSIVAASLLWRAWRQGKTYWRTLPRRTRTLIVAATVTRTRAKTKAQLLFWNSTSTARTLTDDMTLTPMAREAARPMPMNSVQMTRTIQASCRFVGSRYSLRPRLHSPNSLPPSSALLCQVRSVSVGTAHMPLLLPELWMLQLPSPEAQGSTIYLSSSFPLEPER
mmetsp:Transcript_2567/g.7528  ORF Transcript_2567/g.7528 Transcript_2567/m.7528 type:complete len:331 (+) Transcript_2567:698-1690(+)